VRRPKGYDGDRPKVIGGRMASRHGHRWEIAKTAVFAFALTAFLGGISRLSRLAQAGDSGDSGDSKDSLPASRQVLILMRALAYDGNLKARAGGTINIAILQRKGNAASETMARSIGKAFGALESTQVSGLPIVISRMNYTGEEALKRAIAGAGIDLVYVCEGLDADIDAIGRITRQMKVLSVGGKQELVEKGLSIGVFQIESKCTILLNLPASRQEGVSFAADLLRLAKVIR
jgi:YfiR/HmsC-like